MPYVVITLISLSIGCNGMDEAGFTTPDPQEAAVKTAMVKQSDLCVMLADSSKEGAHHLASFAPLEAIDIVISDTDLCELRQAPARSWN